MFKFIEDWLMYKNIRKVAKILRGKYIDWDKLNQSHWIVDSYPGVAVQTHTSATTGIATTNDIRVVWNNEYSYSFIHLTTHKAYWKIEPCFASSTLTAGEVVITDEEVETSVFHNSVCITDVANIEGTDKYVFRLSNRDTKGQSYVAASLSNLSHMFGIDHRERFVGGDEKLKYLIKNGTDTTNSKTLTNFFVYKEVPNPKPLSDVDVHFYYVDANHIRKGTLFLDKNYDVEDLTLDRVKQVVDYMDYWNIDTALLSCVTMFVNGISKQDMYY